MAKISKWTEERVDQIRQMAGKVPACIIAQEMGENVQRIYNTACKHGISLRIPSTTEYAYYRGEEIVAIGTLQEIADQTGLKVRSLQCYLAPSQQKRFNSIKKSAKREAQAVSFLRLD